MLATGTARLFLHSDQAQLLKMLVVRAVSAAPSPSESIAIGPVEMDGPAQSGPWQDVGNDLADGEELVVRYEQDGTLSLSRLDTWGTTLKSYPLPDPRPSTKSS